MSSSLPNDRALEPFWGLAALRIGVCFALLLEDSVGGALVAATSPRELLVYPSSLGDWVPLPYPWTLGLIWLFRAILLSALVGFRTQLCLTGLCLLGLPLLASAQLLGPTVHNMHLLWFLALLAVAPCGQVGSLDAWLRRRSTSEPPLAAMKLDARLTSRAVQALTFARLLLACVYFFPGAWKLGANGLAWASAGRLIPLFHSKWYQFNFLPPLRVDEHPLLLQLGGLSIMALELAFPLLVLSRAGRWTACLGGLIFHVLSAQFLGIRFMPLWLCYGILIDWPSVLCWLQDRSPPNRAVETMGRGLFQRLKVVRIHTPRLNLVSCVGAVLLLGAITQGARGQMQSWPFACYPTFHRPIRDTLPDVLLVVNTGQESRGYPSPRQARLRSQAAWGRTWDLLGYYGTPMNSARLQAYAEQQLTRLDPAVRDAQVTLYQVERSTRPADWDSSPRVIRRLATVQLSASRHAD